jgi:diguanylate cyclase (GGDEF)-like protein
MAEAATTRQAKSPATSPATGPATSEVSKISPLAEENMALKARVAELERLVLLDTLTPLYNRRHFMETLERWVLRARRYDRRCGLLFIDVDQLKNVNDAQGHLAGDALLVSISGTLQSMVRRTDIAARICGDEFGILLENIEPDTLPAKAADVAHAVAGQVLIFEGRSIARSISVGYAAIEAHMSAADILQMADESMYANKSKKVS